MPALSSDFWQFLRERIRFMSTSNKPRHNTPKGANPEQSKPSEETAKPQKSLLATMREWTDAIIIAYVLAMFIRTFVVELFKIPSGSMTPTLVGDYVAEVDYDNNGHKDLLVLKELPPVGAFARYQVFLNMGDRWVYKDVQQIATADISEMARKDKVGPVRSITRSLFGWSGPLHKRNDKIFVNKFAYWFKQPDRGDLIVFKVPTNVPGWKERPIYIKRAVALESETATFTSDETCAPNKGRLTVNGMVMDEPDVFRHLCYAWDIEGIIGPDRPPENTYADGRMGVHFVQSDVPEDHLLALGDNTDSSSDGRYWGCVPLANLKGKAFFRYSPLAKMGFLH